MKHVIAEGMLLLAGARAATSSWTPAPARPRRGSADLPDRDGPDGDRRRQGGELDAVHGLGYERWMVPASVGLAAVVAGAVARAAVLLI
jgi:hypothetical protein